MKRQNARRLVQASTTGPPFQAGRSAVKGGKNKTKKKKNMANKQQQSPVIPDPTRHSPFPRPPFTHTAPPSPPQSSFLLISNVSHVPFASCASIGSPGGGSRRQSRRSREESDESGEWNGKRGGIRVCDFVGVKRNHSNHISGAPTKKQKKKPNARGSSTPFPRPPKAGSDSPHHPSTPQQTPSNPSKPCAGA